MSDPDDVPKGLMLFPSHTPPERRRRRLIFLAVVLGATLALIWPVYPLFSDMRPLIFGLPLSLAWVILWLTIVFGALVWLYCTE